MHTETLIYLVYICLKNSYADVCCYDTYLGGWHIGRLLSGQDGFAKLTFGTCLASGGAWKNGYSLKPNTLAVRFAGN